jgi:hypothetical protein
MKKILFFILFVCLMVLVTSAQASPPSDHAHDYFARAEIYASLNTPEGYLSAIEDYTRAIEVNPNDPWFYRRRSAAYLAVGDKMSAIHDLNIIIADDELSAALK